MGGWWGGGVGWGGEVDPPIGLQCHEGITSGFLYSYASNIARAPSYKNLICTAT